MIDDVTWHVAGVRQSAARLAEMRSLTAFLVYQVGGYEDTMLKAATNLFGKKLNVDLEICVSVCYCSIRLSLPLCRFRNFVTVSYKSSSRRRGKSPLACFLNHHLVAPQNNNSSPFTG